MKGFRFRWGGDVRPSRLIAAVHLCDCDPGARIAAATLADVAPGTSIRVCCLDGEGPLIRRLAEMGFIPGTEVQVIRRAPLSDPVEYQIRGYLVSLRREEATRIRVKALASATGTSLETEVALFPLVEI
jgi:ferrous iron transport protein A